MPDATGVLVHHPERCKSGHFWVLVAPPRHVLFQFSLKHDAAAVDRLLPLSSCGSPNPLGDEAIATAVERDLEGVPVRIMRPEHLAALWLQAGGAKRRERVELLRQAGVLNDALLQALLRKFAVIRKRS